MADKDFSQFAEIEQKMLKVWEKEKTFSKSLEQRKGQKLFSFYDGPPFANGLPHFGHSLVQSIKDSVLRYKTMRGFWVPRRNGWDCHGLPVEYEVEKQFGVSGKKQIMDLGLEKFNAACRASIFKYKDDWETLMRRIGRWSDYDNYYATVDNTYIESVWWVFKQLHEKGLIYKSFKSVPYCPRCATPLSNFELNEGYKEDVKDPSVYVKFPLIKNKASLLAWTTTPWSLPGNSALAVHPDETYVTVEVKNDTGKVERLILAKKRLEILAAKYKIIKQQKGEALAGLAYQPLFKLPPARIKTAQNTYSVVADAVVDIEDGTGVLHVAPSFGEDDLNLGQKYDLPILHSVDENGHMRPDIGFKKVAGEFFKEADAKIISDLANRGLLYAVDDSFTHIYPFCWRCETPLLYYAIESWFLKVTAVKKDLLHTAAKISWVPAHIKKGRFGSWLEGARDWAISRNRYWGSPLPVWANENDKNDYLVIGSIEELKELSGSKALKDLHRPFIDELVIKKDGKVYRRAEEVLDCWFESGSMSAGQWHFPFENKDMFKQTFPADFIIEGLDQTRLWFYVQHVIASILFGKPAFSNVVVNGIIVAADGQKLSKRLRNYPPVEEVFAKEGADSLRLYLLSSPQATENADYMRFDRNGLRDTNRNVVQTLWNTYKFFKTYTDVDRWQPPAKLTEPKVSSVLDRWILARLNETIAEVTAQADSYKLAHAINPIFNLIDDLSNWYVRRSRRRFWKSEDDKDKREAYATLHYVLVRTSQLLAPWAPFLSDYIYRELRGKEMPESVHLTDWPKADKVDNQLILDMERTREAITEGLAQRANAGIKVRQPLSKVVLDGAGTNAHKFIDIISEELNVKQVETRGDGKSDTPVRPTQVKLSTEISHDLRLEGLAREVIRHIQQYRKELDLKVDDRIALALQTSDGELKEAIQAYEELIAAETLATKLTMNVGEAAKPLVVEEAKLQIDIRRV